MYVLDVNPIDLVSEQGPTSFTYSLKYIESYTDGNKGLFHKYVISKLREVDTRRSSVYHTGPTSEKQEVRFVVHNNELATLVKADLRKLFLFIKKLQTNNLVRYRIRIPADTIDVDAIINNADISKIDKSGIPEIYALYNLQETYELYAVDFDDTDHDKLLEKAHEIVNERKNKHETTE